MVKTKLFEVQAKHGTLSTTTLVPKWFKNE
jgi:hypothetical protein